MPKKILIIDDNANSRLLMRDILEHHDFEIIEAENGLQGVEKARTHKPDLILMDIYMPEMDGFEAVRMIKSDPDMAGVKIAAVSSFKWKPATMQAVCDAYISKPISTRELPNKVKKLLE